MTTFHVQRIEEVQVTSTSVRLSDTIDIGGLSFRVKEMIGLPGGGKLIIFDSGETLTLLFGTRIAALREVRKPVPRRTGFGRRVPGRRDA